MIKNVLVLMLLVFVSACIPTTEQEQKHKEQKYKRSVELFKNSLGDDKIVYGIDPRTNLCFAEIQYVLGTFTHVPCTEEVLELIGEVTIHE